MVKTFDILLDIEKELYSPSNLLFSVSTNDLNNIQLNFVITQDGTPLDLTNKTIELGVKKPSGIATYQDCEITNGIEGKATVLLSLQAYDEYGFYTAEVYVKEIDNLSVTSPFYYLSKSAVLETEAIGGGNSNYFIFGDGAPIDAPARVGQIYIDQLNKSAYIATGEMVEDWEAIDNEQFVKQAITWAEVLDKPTAFTPEIHTHDYVDIQGKPLAFPPEEHGHEIIEITGLQDALNLKADDSDLTTKANSADVYTKLETYNKTEVDTIVTGITEGGGTIVEDNLLSNSSSSALSANQGRILDETKADSIHRHDWAEIDGKPLTFAPESHVHEITEITGLQTALDGKADDADLLGKADVNHVHSYTSLTDIPTTFKPNLASSTVVGGHKVGNGLGMSGEYLLVKSGNGLRTDGASTYQVEIDRNVVDTWYAKNEQLNGLTIWSGTLDEYKDIPTKDNSTIYLITEIKPILNVTSLTNAVQLNWEVGTATSWTIWRSEVKGDLGTKLVGSLVTNNYLDSTALGGTTYYYTLQVDDVSEKTISNQVEAKPYTIIVNDAKRVEFTGYAGWTVYGTTEATADFGNVDTLQGGDRLKVDTTERLRFYLPAGMVGSANTGGIIKAKIAGKNNYTFEYGIRFDSGFPWSKGGKVPGFSGGAGYTGGAPAWDGDGFSVRLMWREGGRIIPYVYHYNQPDEFGDTFGETLGYFTDLKEHIIKYYAVLNTGANPDGILKIYLDGVQVFEKRDLVYRTDESLIDTAHLAIFAGGSDATWNMSADGYIRLGYVDWR